MLFVGCSMTDELIRRALRRSVVERIEHLREAHPKAPLKEPDWRRQFAVMKMKEDEGANKAINDSLAFLGVWPLWVSDYDKDLPRRIRQLRASMH